jgi:hypothetical protein
MRRPTIDQVRRVAVLGGVFVLAVAIAAAVIRPWIAAPIGFDTAASVLHFERITSGTHLEAPLSTTPKPLLTLLYGLLYVTTHDWRAISVAALVAWGLGVTSAAALAYRLGGTVAGLFCALLLLLSAPLLLETAWALGGILALPLWFAAGLAVTAERPRWGLAGVALGIATLARLETLLVVGLGLVVLAAIRFGPKARRRETPQDAWRISIGLLALPVMCLHDAVLTGDPLFWTKVAAAYSAAAATAGRLPSLGDVADELAALVTGQIAIALLALVGGAVLAARARWSVLIGVLALGPGMAVLLLALAARHVFVDPRYLVPISVAMVFSASIGLGAVRIPELAAIIEDRLRRQGISPARERAMAIGIGGPVVIAVAILFSATVGPLDRSTLATIASARRLAQTADQALPTIRAALVARAAVSTTGGDAVGAAPTQLFVPIPVRPRVAVDLGLSLDQVGSYADPRVWAAAAPRTGQMILISTDPSSRSAETSQFQLSAPATVAGVRLAPLLSDPRDGVWLLQVAAP